jgi:hypothetical protein
VAEGKAPRGARNRVLPAVLGGLIVLTIAAQFLTGGGESSSTSSTPPPNARAVLVATEDAERMVVVAPCNTDAELTERDAARDEPTPGAVRLELPRGSGSRAILVPHCNPTTRAMTASGEQLPSALFVLPAGTRTPTLKTPPLRADAQVIVPARSRARTIVVPACTGRQPPGSDNPKAPPEGKDKDVVLETGSGSSRTATAPPC